MLFVSAQLISSPKRITFCPAKPSPFQRPTSRSLKSFQLTFLVKQLPETVRPKDLS